VVDFVGQLRRQLSFLESSCELYDKGKVEEAVRIAVVLRVIFHDTAKSVSLLRHLNAKSVFLLTTAVSFADENSEIPSLYLIELVANVDPATFRCDGVPLLAKNYGSKLVDFNNWWEKEVVIDLKGSGGTFNRRGLVLEAANTDGGAHVGTKLDSKYEKAMNGGGISLAITFKDGRGIQERLFQNVHYASLRQVAYEVLNSPALLALAGTRIHGAEAAS
jgi:hypothetical protein